MKNILANKNNLIIIALIGIMLLVIAIPAGKSESSLTKVQTEEKDSIEIEERLEKALKNTEGVGEVRVMITGSDESSVFDEKENSKVQGVVVVAEGAEDAAVKKKIQDIVLALFPIEAHKIEIVKMK